VYASHNTIHVILKERKLSLLFELYSIAAEKHSFYFRVSDCQYDAICTQRKQSTTEEYMFTRRRFVATLMTAVTAVAAPSLALASDPLKVAIAMPGTATDKGWSEAAFRALERAKTELGIDYAYSEKIEQPDQVEVLSDYARKGYKLVIGHGGEYQDAVERVAKEFPQTMFMVNNGLKPHDNIANADFHFSQLGYLMGYTAAKVSKSKKIGVLVAQEFKFTNDSVAGFRAGAEAAVPGTVVVYSVTGMTLRRVKKRP
jgi:basic membrane protein A and related proteins